MSRKTIAISCLVPLLVALASPVLATEPIDLSAQAAPGGTARVTVELQVGGDVLVRPGSDESSAIGELQKFPISVTAKIQYDERRLPPTSAGAARSARHYNEATAVIKVADGGESLSLADDRRLIVVEEEGGRVWYSCPDGLMDREQLDLVDVLGNSLFVDRLLPSRPVADGDTWNQDATIMGGLLCLDSVAVCEVQSVLEEFNQRSAKVRLAGVVHGTADGTATEQEVRGVYLFDRQQRRITRFNLAVREKRTLGAASRGLDVVSSVRIGIEPAKTPPGLDNDSLASLLRAKRPAAGLLLYDSPEQGFRVEYDRQWHVTDQRRESITMRRISEGDLVAQCTLTRLPPKSEGRQTTLEQFEKDIRYSLGERFGQLVSSRQWVNSHGHYCYEVVARGTVEEMPLEWHYFLVAPDSGHRVTAAVTIEGSMVDRLARADRELIETLELIPAEDRPADTAARSTGEPAR